MTAPPGTSPRPITWQPCPTAGDDLAVVIAQHLLDAVDGGASDAPKRIDLTSRAAPTWRGLHSGPAGWARRATPRTCFELAIAHTEGESDRARLHLFADDVGDDAGHFTSGAPNRAFAGYVATLPRTLRENVDAMLSLVHLCQRPTLTLADGARLLQVSEAEAKDRLDALASGPDSLTERDGDSRRGVRWRLRPSVASAALGTAVQHRARADSARPRVEAHLKEYGWITNKTIRNMFDLDVQQATQILNVLRAANAVVKDPDGPQRGPSIRWLPANPAKDGKNAQ